MAEMRKPLLLLAAHLGISCPAPVRMQLSRPDAARGLTGREMLQRMAGAAQQGPRGTPVPFRERPGGAREQRRPPRDGGVPGEACRRHAATAGGAGAGHGQRPHLDAALLPAAPLLHVPRPSLLLLRVPGPAALSSCGTRNSSWDKQACVYTVHYGDKSVTTGVLGVDTFTFASAVVVPNVTFGCGMLNNGNFMSNETGIAGFGRGPLSLPSQLKVDNFSYCFTDMKGSKPSPVLLGLPPADTYSSSVVQTTPLTAEGHHRRVGHARHPGVHVRVDQERDGRDRHRLRHRAITMLPPRVYRLVRDAFVSQVKLRRTRKNDDDGMLCFAVPRLVFHFEGATLGPAAGELPARPRGKGSSGNLRRVNRRRGWE
jgi:hypothetical protein